MFREENTMKVSAVRNYKSPAYPTRAELKELPDYASEKSWNDKLLKTSLAMAMTATLLNGCTNNGYPFDPFGGEELAGSIAAPYILTEEEALKIIYEEASAAGIHLKADAYSVDHLKLVADKNVIKSLYPGFSDTFIEDTENWFNEAIAQVNETEISFLVDGYDEEKKIGIEYISGEDDELRMVNDFNLKALVNYSLEQSETDKYIKVISAEGYNSSREDAIEDLKKQLQEFFDFLRAEGVL